MVIDEGQIRHLAALAHLTVPAGDEQRLAGELARILEYAERIGDAEAEEEPPALPREETDEPRPGLDREEVLAAAPEVAHGLVRVPPLRRGEDGDG